MLPREFVEKLLGRFRPTGSHVLVALADALDSVLVIMVLPLKVVGKGIIKSVGRALTAAAGEILELRESLGLHQHGFHSVDQYPMNVRLNSAKNPILYIITRHDSPFVSVGTRPGRSSGESAEANVWRFRGPLS